ncbi:hypothetical protein CEW89_13960 [Celeribacter ethanolicus]|uniref:Uncharacterized protein n=1 Tax=Celeribacter ethanolicus TaxID=1758178 RepID=A0A291GEE6_9RHOB|nr:hypothetical protein [Celeribacter ethanolicus]ATG48565.1 hypothetical protein CEW89_13960 [Celeribacter ethanolicus]
MLEAYWDLINQYCDQNIVAEVQTLEFGQTEDVWKQDTAVNDVSRQLKNDSQCLEAYVGYLAYSVNASTPAEVNNTFLDIALRLPLEKKAHFQKAMEWAYAHMTYAPRYSRLYFDVAGLYSIDLREKFHPKFEKAFFTDHTDEAFGYYQYLVSIDDPRGLARFDEISRRVEGDVNALFKVLNGLTEQLPSAEHSKMDVKAVLNILKRYKNDQRRIAGVYGPGTGPSLQEYLAPIFQIYGR